MFTGNRRRSENVERKHQDRVVIVGSGGREHALAWKLRQSKHVRDIICIPGNAGIADVAACEALDIGKLPELVARIVALRPQLVVVGPEKPLVDGIVDLLASFDIPVFGPSKAAAQIEGSKAWSKRLMERAGVPTATFLVTDDMKKAEDYIEQAMGQLVVKADGLCGGKGVIVCKTRDEALAAAHAILVLRIHGEQGARIVIEDRLFGREVSVMALVDGERILLLPTAQDYKRREDGDLGAMTGGMGCMSPSPFVTPELLAQIRETVLAPVVRTMAEEGTPFCGLLYAGLMLTESGPMVLEFNARFGDPETQVVLPRIEQDLYELLWLAAKGNLSSISHEIPVTKQTAVCVVQCADTYPDKGSKDRVIDGLEKAATVPGVTVFHAGTSRAPHGSFVTNGGRVLGTMAMGDSPAHARRRAYGAVACIYWPGEAHRTDIAFGL